MNNIGFGIFCFGEEFYYKGAYDKIKRILNDGYHCYVLTENPDYFTQRFSSMYLHLISYDRSFKSYADKMILPKYILKQHQIAILIDADSEIIDPILFNDLKKYPFKYGITYIDTLINHRAKKEFVKDLIGSDNPEWSPYINYVNKHYQNYGELETMWEYFLVINKTGFNADRFYKHYERLQVAKEFSDLGLNKPINGAGEGISIQIAAKLSDSDIQKDIVLFEILKGKIKSLSKKHTPLNEQPNWMR